MAPVWFRSDDALDFLMDVLGEPASVISQKFELWALTRKSMY
jgi:hypothetical protein